MNILPINPLREHRRVGFVSAGPAPGLGDAPQFSSTFISARSGWRPSGDSLIEDMSKSGCPHHRKHRRTSDRAPRIGLAAGRLDPGADGALPCTDSKDSLSGDAETVFRVDIFDA